MISAASRSTRRGWALWRGRREVDPPTVPSRCGTAGRQNTTTSRAGIDLIAFMYIVTSLRYSAVRLWKILSRPTSRSAFVLSRTHLRSLLSPESS